MKPRKMARTTEYGATTMEEIDAWMQRRIGYFGKPCLTSQEYRAVVYSLFGLPEVTVRQGDVLTVELEQPTQTYVATKMRVRQQRVSQLLDSAGRALIWFEVHNTPDVGWKRRKHGRGAAAWDFLAPVLDRPIPPDPQQRKASVEIVRLDSSYKLAFAGELAETSFRGVL